MYLYHVPLCAATQVYKSCSVIFLLLLKFTEVALSTSIYFKIDRSSLLLSMSTSILQYVYISN